MACGCDRCRQLRKHFQPGGGCDDLALDPGAGEQEVHDDVGAVAFQADSRQALHIFLLKYFHGPIPASS
jgi:hypothetical protein